jgi:hypothetical protein
MSAAAKIHPAGDASPDLDAIVSDVVSLRHDIAALMEHLKIGAIDGANGLAQDAANRLSSASENLYATLSARSGESMKAISRKVAEQPVISPLLAFALGFIGSRWLSR